MTATHRVTDHVHECISLHLPAHALWCQITNPLGRLRLLQLRRLLPNEANLSFEEVLDLCHDRLKRRLDEEAAAAAQEQDSDSDDDGHEEERENAAAGDSDDLADAEED